MPKNSLGMEAVVVGIVTALALALATWLWPEGTRFPAILVLGLVVGAGLHLAFEMTGMNAAYCRTGHACSA